MPIPVKCPSCSHKFSVKDEYAGKRAKCPECEEPLSIPGGAAPMPAARPKSSPIAKALDDEAAESPKAKRRRDEDDDDLPRAKKRRDDDEGDEKPRAKKRREDDEDEDDRPRGNRRRRDEDGAPPKKKSNALVIILSIVGAVVLLCGGTCGGVWWFVLKPAGETFASFVTAAEQRQAARDSFKDNFQKVKAGMTKKEVDDLLGPNSAKAQEHDVGRVTMMLSDWPKSEDRWKPKAKAGHVLLWDKSGDGVLVAYSTDPNAGGTVVGAVGNFGLSASEPIKLPAAEPTGDVNNPVATLTAAELTAQFAKYRDRWVTVSGAFSAVDTLNPFSVVLTTPPGFTLTVHPPPGGRFPLADPPVQPRESLTFTGKVGGDSIAVQLKEGKFVSRTGGTPPKPVDPKAALTVADVLRDHVKLRGGSVTVRGKVKLVVEEVDGTRGHIEFDVGGGTIGLRAKIPDGKWRTRFLQGEDTVELSGTVAGLAGNPGTGQSVEMLNCDLLKRTTKDGKDVPLPPVTPPLKAVAVAAETLAAEFAQNIDNAAKKYTDKAITVTGTVDKVSPTGIRVTLKGVAAADNKKAYVVDVGMTAAGRDDAKKFKEGDVVKLTGKYTLFRPAGASNPNTVLLSNAVVEK